MDKIYSRRRIKIFYSDRKAIRKKIVCILIVVIIVVTVGSMVKSIDPIFHGLCEERAMAISTEIVNNESTKVLEKYDYKDIVSITKSERDNTNILKTDVKVINDIASDIAVEALKALQENEKKLIEIPVGSLSGNKYLSGVGPKIKISVIPAGKIATELKTEFESKGINQTIYRIYLDITCDVDILTSYKTIKTTMSNQVLLVETVIVGDVPQTYYNLEGINRDNTIDIIE